MKKIGIFFGSETGNTKKIAYFIYNKISIYFYVKVLNIAKSSKNDFLDFDIFILGTSTWYCGELQNDWNEFLNILKTINLDGKTVAFFGCGNQENYSDFFCNGMYFLYKVIIKKKVNLIGYWPNINYNFIHSKSLFNKKYFIGLVIDEDCQLELTENRLSVWLGKLLLDINNI